MSPTKFNIKKPDRIQSGSSVQAMRTVMIFGTILADIEQISSRHKAEACCTAVVPLKYHCSTEYHKQVTVATRWGVCSEYHKQVTVATQSGGVPEYHKQVTVATQGWGIRVPLTSNGCHSYVGHEYHKQVTVATPVWGVCSEYHKQVTVATQRVGVPEYHKQVTVATQGWGVCFEYHKQVTVATQSGQRVPLTSNGCHSLCCHLVPSLNSRKATLVNFWGKGKIYVWGNEMSILLTNLKGYKSYGLSIYSSPIEKQRRKKERKKEESQIRKKAEEEIYHERKKKGTEVSKQPYRASCFLLKLPCWAAKQEKRCSVSGCDKHFPSLKGSGKMFVLRNLPLPSLGASLSKASYWSAFPRRTLLILRAWRVTSVGFCLGLKHQSSVKNPIVRTTLVTAQSFHSSHWCPGFAPAHKKARNNKENSFALAKMNPYHNKWPAISWQKQMFKA